MASVLAIAAQIAPAYAADSPSFDGIRAQINQTHADLSSMKAFEYDPLISVNPNHGNFTKSVSFPLPPNLVGLTSLELRYDSQNSENVGWGAGWSLDLPMISANRTSLTSAPILLSGPAGRGALVRTGEDLAQLETRVRDILGERARAIYLTPYRLQVDLENYVLVVRIDAPNYRDPINWILFQPTGSAWLFDRHGLPIRVLNARNQALALEWQGGTLSAITDPGQSWRLEVNYKEEQKGFSRYYHGWFRNLPEGAASIQIRHPKSARGATYAFKYRGPYLTQILQRGAALPRLQANYSAAPSKIWTEGGRLQPKQDAIPIFRESISEPTYINPDKNYLWVDLNGDGRSDRVLVGESLTNPMTHEIESIFQKEMEQLRSELKKSRPESKYEADALFEKYAEEAINRLNPQFDPIIRKHSSGIRFEIAQWSPATGTVNYVEDPTLRFTGETFLPFRIWGQFNTDNKNLSLKGIDSGVFFVDLYSTGKKAFINCAPDRYLEVKKPETTGQNSAPSNLHLSILSLIAPDQVQGMDFTPVWDAPKGQAVVWKQVANEEALRASWQETKDFSAPFGSRPPLLGVYRWQQSEENFKCNSHSIFFDANQDGVVDVLTGSTLYLRGLELNGVRTEVVQLENTALTELFSAPERINLESAQQSLLWDPKEQKFLLRNGIFSIDAEKGLRRLEGHDRTSMEEPAPHFELLDRLIAPAGGNIRAAYGFEQGVWAIKKVLWQSGDKQPNAESKYFYESGNREPESGVFLGFGRTREARRILDLEHRLPDHDIVRRYFEDKSPSVIHYHSRARLQGLLMHESTRLPAEIGTQIGAAQAAEAKDLFWVVAQVKSPDSSEFQNRWFAYPNVIETKKFLDSQDVSSGKRIEKTFTDWHLDSRGLPTLPSRTWRKTTDIRQSRSSPDSIVIDDGASHYEGFAFIPGVYKNTLINEYSTDARDRSFRYPKALDVNLFGEPERVCEGSICTQFIYDSFGRLHSLSVNTGAWTQASYQEASPLITSLKDQDTEGSEYRIVADPLTGRISEVKNPEGRTTQIDRTEDGIPIEIRTRDLENGTFQERLKRFLPELRKVGDHLHIADPVVHWADGRRLVSELDAWARTFRSRSDSPDGEIFSGETISTPTGHLLETTLPSFANFNPAGPGSYRAASRAWDPLGRIRTDWSYSDGSWIYSYRGNCKTQTLNKSLQVQRCTNIFEKPTSIKFYGEETNYLTNHLGDIQATTDNKRWERDLHGEIVRTTGGGSPASGDSATWSNRVKIDPLARTRESESGWWTHYDPANRLLESKRTGDSRPTDLFEKRSYRLGKIVGTTISTPKGEAVDALEQAFQYNSAGLPVSIKIGRAQLERRYDSSDRLVAETVGLGPNEVNQLELIYQKGFLTQIPGLIARIKRNEEGAIIAIQYDSGLELTRGFDLRSKRVARVHMEKAGKAASFSESYTYHPATHLLTQRSGISESTANWNEEFKYRGGAGGAEVFLVDAPSNSRSLKRDGQGRLLNLESVGTRFPITWNDDNLAQIDGNSIYYNAEGSWIASCPAGKPISDQNCIIRLDRDRVLIRDKTVTLIRVEGLPVALQYGTALYPILTDHLGSIRALWSSNGNQLLWSRRYNAWGKKSVNITAGPEQLLAQTLEEACVWSFAGLVEIPGIKPELYWSTSRVYSPDLQEWLSPDPLVRWTPHRADAIPGNWNSTRYANNSPLVYVDPSGNWVTIAAGAAIGGFAGGLSAYNDGKDFGEIAARAAIGGFFGALGGLSLGSVLGLNGAAAIAVDGAFASVVTGTESVINSSLDGATPDQRTSDLVKSVGYNGLAFGAGKIAAPLKTTLDKALNGFARKGSGEITEALIGSIPALHEMLEGLVKSNSGNFNDGIDSDLNPNTSFDQQSLPLGRSEYRN